MKKYVLGNNEIRNEGENMAKKEKSKKEKNEMNL